MADKVYDIITKGVYEVNQPQNAVPLRNYILLNDNGKKNVLLRFFNPRRQKLTGLELKITSLDHGGNILSERTEVFYKLSGKPLKEFVLTKRIEIHPQSADFKIEVLKAKYGQYEYSSENGREKADYCFTEDAKFDVGKALDKLAWEKAAVTERTDNQRILIGVASFILVVALIAFTVFQLIAFVKLQPTFLYGGVEYAFVDNKKDKGMGVYVVGVRFGVFNVNIPEEIDGRKVVKIESKAFENNGVIRSLTAEGEIIIEDYAFSNCKRLEKVNLPKATDIGKEAFMNCPRLSSVTCDNLDKIDDFAFKGCTALKNVTITSERKKVNLGAKVFDGCTNLENVDISERIVYGDYNLFSGCIRIKNLKLGNFSVGNNARTLLSLFGEGAKGKNLLTLENVEISNLDAIGDNFLSGAPTVSVTIGSLSGSAIGANAFSGCEKLTTLKLPKSISRVGDNAFKNTRLNSFDFSQTEFIGSYAFAKTSIDSAELPVLKSLGEYAFWGSGITFVTLSPTLSEISQYAFRGCEKLTSFSVPATIREIGLGALAECTSLGEISVPFTGRSRGGQETHLGYIFGAETHDSPSQKIPTSLTKVSLTEGEEIADYAFYGCSSAQTINFPDTITSIGANAFGKCSALKGITIPSSVTQIKGYAFSDCIGFTSFTIPETVNSLGQKMLLNCKKITELTLATLVVSGDPQTTDIESTLLNLIFGAVPTHLEKVIVTSGTTIPNNAFRSCAKLKTVIMPENTISIGEYAFAYSGIADIEIPQTVTSIGDHAFAGCNNLLKFKIPASVERIGEYTTFRECYKLWEIWNYSGQPVKAPNAIVREVDESEDILQKFYIDGYQFGYDGYEDKYYLLDYPETTENLTLPSNFDHNGKVVEEYVIHSYFFDGNSKIKKLYIPANVSKISDYAFANCAYLESVEIDSNAKFTEIGAYAFAKCTKLASINIPVGVTKILANAFEDCAALKSVSTSSLTEIADNAFLKCKMLDSLFLNKNIKKIGAGAFKNCESLSGLNLPDSLTEIGASAFENCYSLRWVNLPSTLTAIGDSAFSNCSRLLLVRNFSSLNIVSGSVNYGYVGSNAIFVATGDDGYLSNYYDHEGIDFLFYKDDWVALGLTRALETLNIDSFSYNEKQVASITIRSAAFDGRASLKNVVLGSVVKSVGIGVFNSCSNIESVDMSCPITEIPDSMFSNCGSIKSIKLPSALTRISNMAFSNCGSLTEINIPESVEWIGVAAFSYCTSLKSVSIPNSTKGIEAYAFANCNALTAITIPDSVKEIGSYAFDGCEKVDTLNLGSGVNRIGSCAFRKLGKIESVVIPQSMTLIEDGAFSECYRLAVVYDLSKLKITQRSYSNGWVGYYAIVVFDDINEKAEFFNAVAYSYDYSFVKIKGDWYLYNYTSVFDSSSTSIVRLPETVFLDVSGTSGVSAIREYIIKDYALERLHSGDLIIPAQVKGIQERALTSTGGSLSIYYKGSEEEWLKIRPSRLAVVHTRYYVGCVHDGLNEWTFIKEEGSTVESLSVEPHYYGFDWSTQKSATCTEAGVDSGTCKKCKVYKTERFVSELGHDYSPWTVLVSPTCTKSGESVRNCLRCQSMTEKKEILPLGHNYIDGVCTRCNEADPNHKKEESQPDNSTGT